MDLPRLLPWAVRVSWAVLPFVAGPAFAGALDIRSDDVRTAASVGLWAVWAVVVCATLVLHPVSLTLLRLAAPAAVVAGAWSLAEGRGAAPLVAVAATVAAAALAFLPETGAAFVNGPAYPNERRFPLRVPGPLLFGPLVLAWAATVGAPVAAVLLLAARNWVAGGVAVLAAAAAVFVLGRALHGLSRRWVVFVPAGLVLHDPITLADPVLFTRSGVRGLELARAGTDAVDLTSRAQGLAIEVELGEPANLVLTRPGQRVGPTVVTERLIFTPTRPGQVLAEARRRRLTANPAARRSP